MNRTLRYVILFGGVLIAFSSSMKLSFLNEVCVGKAHDILFIKVSHIVKHVTNLVFGILLIIISFRLKKQEQL